MNIARINAITFTEEYGEVGLLCVLSPEIDAVEYLEKLNKKINPYNEAIKNHHEKVKELEELYKRNASFEEVTGEVILNLREPKYPAEMPKGSKSAEETYPEVAIERNRRARHNDKYRQIYYQYGQDIDDKINAELKYLTDEIATKWPEFKDWYEGSYYSSRVIYQSFELTSIKYVSK